jgi:hypothetical protein
MFQTTTQILYDSIDGISMTTWKKKTWDTNGVVWK